MNISVELTLTPIQDDYEPAIINFITSLRNSGLTVKENPLSTQVYGDYDTVMNLLNKEMKTALAIAICLRFLFFFFFVAGFSDPIFCFRNSN